MSNTANNKKKTSRVASVVAAKGAPLNLRLDNDLAKELDDAVKTTGLDKSSLARLSLARGLKILQKQLSTPVEVAA